MVFKKYPSIENSYRKKFIGGFVNHYPELLTATYVITEKIHGANFQAYFEPNEPWRYGKRTAWLKPNEKFYNYQQITERYQEMFTRIQKIVDKQYENLRLFGELYGPGIQKGVNYGDEKQIGFFDVMINDQLMPPRYFLDSARHLFEAEDNLLPVVGTVPNLQAALAFDAEFNSLLNPIEGNVCEGIVIKPRDAVYYDGLGRRFCLKKKNEKFAEKVKATKPKRPADPLVDRLNLEFRSHITDNRLQSIFSQHGEIEEPTQIGNYIRLVLSDAKEDFLKDFSNEIDTLPKNKQRKVFNVGSMIALMLKEYL